MENRDWYQKREGQAEHLVYLDNEDKELEKLINGEKTMIIRGAAGKKSPLGGGARKRTISCTLLKRAGKWKSLIVVC